MENSEKVCSIRFIIIIEALPGLIMDMVKCLQLKIEEQLMFSFLPPRSSLISYCGNCSLTMTFYAQPLFLEVLALPLDPYKVLKGTSPRRRRGWAFSVRVVKYWKKLLLSAFARSPTLSPTYTPSINSPHLYMLRNFLFCLYGFFRPVVAYV